MDTRFPILISPLWRPLLLLFGATPGLSYVAIEDDMLHARFGLLFDRRFPLTTIESVHRSSWPFLYGIGWRTNFLGRFGLIGSHTRVVDVRFKERQKVWRIVPCRRLSVSLVDPDGFVEALSRRLEAVQA